MNTGLNRLFKTVSVIRLLGIPILFILDKLWRDTIPDSGFLKGIDIRFSFWEYLIMFGTPIIFLVNTIAGLLLSFTPGKISQGILKSKTLCRVFYTAELGIFPFILYVSFMHVKDTFFPPDPTLLGEILNTILSGNKGVSVYEKLQAIDFCILACCSLFFIIFFWKFYKSRIKSYS